MDNLLEEKDKKQYGKFQKFIMIIFIPFLLSVTLALIVLTVAGINVFEKSKEISQSIPFIGSSDKGASPTTEDFEKELVKLEAQINDKQAEIESLSMLIDDKDTEIEKILLEKEQLEQEMEKLIESQEINTRAFKDIIKTYETMTPKKAAPIITQMNDEEALKILSSIKSDTLASIMEKMAPEDAARFTELLSTDVEMSDEGKDS